MSHDETTNDVPAADPAIPGESPMAEALRVGREVAELADAVLAEDGEAAEQAPAPEAPAPAEAEAPEPPMLRFDPPRLSEPEALAAQTAPASEAQPPAVLELPVRESQHANPLPISVGRIVLVQIGGEVMPGIVSRVHNQDVIGVHAFVPRTHNPVVYYDPVRYDAAGGGMTWRWPPRV